MELSAISIDMDSFYEKCYEKWLAALVALLEKEKRGAQARLSREVEVTSKHMNDIVHGRKRASHKLQEAISIALGRSYEDMLRFGGRLLNPEPEPFPDYDRIMLLPLVERAWAIVRKAAEPSGMTSYASALGDKRMHTSRNKIPPPIADFLNGKIAEIELYEFYVDFFGQKVDWINKEIEKRRCKTVTKLHT